MEFPITVTMIRDPQTFLFKDINEPFLSAHRLVRNAQILTRPEAGVERPVIVTDCNDASFTLELGKGGKGELPLTVKLLVIGG